ncbi:MAG: MarR family winged helix-turn-helix transcriptional regulator [Syntrophobacteraceae bacterium]
MTPAVLDLHHTGDEPHLLREIMRTHQAVLNVFSRQVGMPAARLALMRLLAIRHPEAVGIMEIARQLGINAAAVTRQVKVMESERLVERSADARDGRRSYVNLTAEGLRIFEQLHERGHAFEQALSSAVSAEDMAAAVRVLVHLRAAVEALQ